jgi:hypothetical protein
MRVRLAAREGSALQMFSEYDFLYTYSRRLRRVATFLVAVSAVLAGAVSMGLVIALPLHPRSNTGPTGSPVESAPAAGPSQKDAQPVAESATNTTTGNFETQDGAPPTAAGVDNNANSNPQTADALTPPSPQSIRDSTPNETKKENETVAPTEQNGRATTRKKTVATTVPRAANPGDRRQLIAEKPPGAAKRTADKDTLEQKPVRPEPFSIQEFLASHR